MAIQPVAPVMNINPIFNIAPVSPEPKMDTPAKKSPRKSQSHSPNRKPVNPKIDRREYRNYLIKYAGIGLVTEERFGQVF